MLGGRKLQPLKHQNWGCVWPSVVRSAAFYYLIAVKPVCRQTDRGLDNGCYALQYELPSVENSQIFSYTFFSRLGESNIKGEENLRN